MNTVKILHCADIHIGAAESFLGLSADKRRFETLVTFEKIIDLALEKNVAIIALAGDLFDSNRIEPRFVDAVFAKIAAAAPIKVVYAAGNHDPLDSQSPFLSRDLPDNLYVLGVKDDCIPFDDLGVKVYGRSFESSFLKGEEKFSLGADEKSINIMVQHGELKSDLNSDYNALTPKFVKNCGMDYIALGHVHKRSEIGKIDNTYFAYCGCPEGQGFDELDEKGVYIGEVGKGICHLEFVAVSKRRHIHQKIDISACKDSGEVALKILSCLEAAHGPDFKDHLYKIELTGEIDEEVEIDTAEILSRISPELYYVKIKDSTDIRFDLEALATETSLKGVFVKKLLEKQQNATPELLPLYKEALKIGIKAFSAEVKYNED